MNSSTIGVGITIMAVHDRFALAAIEGSENLAEKRTLRFLF